MDKGMEVDDNKKNYPPLPPNYVSIAMLQERWLQRKQQEVEERRQKPHLDDVKVKPTTQGFSRTPQNSYNRGPRIEGQHVSDNQVRSRFKGNVSAGFPRVNGMARNVNQREIGEGKYRKIINGVEKGPNGFGKNLEDKDCSRRQEKNLSCNSAIGGTATVFMIREVPDEIVSKEIKPVEFINISDGKTDKDTKNLRKNVYCNAGIDGTASVCRVEAVPEIVSKEIRPVELISKSDAKTVKDRDNLRKNVSRNAGIEGRASVFRVEAVPEIGSKQIKPVEFSRKVDGKTVQDRGNVRKNLSCNSSDNEGRASVFMVEAVPEIVSKEIKPVEFSRKVDSKTVQDRGDVRKNMSCNSSDNEGTASVFMVEAVPEIVSKEIKPDELIRNSDGKTVQDKGNVMKNLSCNSGVEGTASVSMAEAVPGIVSKEIKPADLIKKSDGKMDKDRDNSRKNGGWKRRGKSSGRKSKVEELPENSMKKEDLGVVIGKNAPINGDDDCVVEVLLENKEKEGALLGSGHSKGSERFGGEVERKWRKKTEAKKPSDSKDKNTLEETMEKGTEDEVLTGDNKSSLQKGTGGRNVQGYRIARNFRDLSFVERRRNFWKYPRYQVMQKPAVWVKRGEISATNVDESGNSDPSKLESTGMDEDEAEAEAQGQQI